jgi:peptidoglycan hydrolase FlgJ
MNVQLSSFAAIDAVASHAAAGNSLPNGKADDPQLRQTFDTFVGEALFAQTLKSMRQTVGKAAYFHGGQAEEIFQQQLDQVLATKLSEASSDKLTGPMFELFSLQRK